MINQMDKNEIIVMHNQGTSIKEIVRITGLSRNTVRKYIRDYTANFNKLNETTDVSTIALIQQEICSAPKRKTIIKKRTAFTDLVERDFNSLIELSKQKDTILGKNKQILTSVKIHKELLKLGHTVGLSTITAEYAKYKDKHRDVYIRQEYDPGFRAEYDFHQIKLKIGKRVKVYHQATIVLPYSNYVFTKLYHNENMQSVIDSLICFFNEINGVPTELVFDNMSTVVKRLMIRTKHKTYTDDIIKLSNYYGFKINTCNVRSGWEKGTVENAGKIVRNELFSLNYEFDIEDDLVSYYTTEIKNLNNTPDKYQKLIEEKDNFINKPIKNYLYFKESINKVNSYSTVRIDNIFYSVPEKYVGKSVKVHNYQNSVLVYDNQKLISKHEKKDGYEYILDITHYLNTFKRKPGALRNSAALKQYPNLKTIFETNYITRPQKFLEDLFGITTDEVENIENACLNQLNELTKLINNGEQSNESNISIS